MQIIPNVPYATSSQAEGEVFYKLQNCFNNDDFIAYHSLNLSASETFCFKEADFVILSKYGLFVLEVKGGGVFSKDDDFYTTDKSGQSMRIKNPFRQAKEALFAICDALSAYQKTSHINLAKGFGVVCPQSSLHINTIEWPTNLLCNNRSFIDFASWLEGMMSYWRTKSGNDALLNQDDFMLLKQFFRL